MLFSEFEQVNEKLYIEIFLLDYVLDMKAQQSVSFATVLLFARPSTQSLVCSRLRQQFNSENMARLANTLPL